MERMSAKREADDIDSVLRGMRNAMFCIKNGRSLCAEMLVDKIPTYFDWEYVERVEMEYCIAQQIYCEISGIT